jgi:hypothetical protein
LNLDSNLSPPSGPLSTRREKGKTVLRLRRLSRFYSENNHGNSENLIKIMVQTV